MNCILCCTVRFDFAWTVDGWWRKRNKRRARAVTRAGVGNRVAAVLTGPEEREESDVASAAFDRPNPVRSPVLILCDTLPDLAHSTCLRQLKTI